MPTVIYAYSTDWMNDWHAQPPGRPLKGRTRVKRTRLYSPVFFAVMAALCLVLFVVNVFHGTWLGLISTGEIGRASCRERV